MKHFSKCPADGGCIVSQLNDCMCEYMTNNNNKNKTKQKLQSFSEIQIIDKLTSQNVV